MKRGFRLVDVFGERRLTGNPLAVVVDSEALSTVEMLEITRWLNFSETTFVSPPESSEADYKARIFALVGELPFAGHPTLGSCHVWRSVTGSSSDEIIQECGAGLVPVRRTGDTYAFRAPDLIRDGPVDPGYLDLVALVLGVATDEIVASRWVDNGPGWVGVMLESGGRVLELNPDFSVTDERLDIGVVGLHPMGSLTACEVRAFYSDQNGHMVEDPVTGSLNASFADWLMDLGHLEAPYTAAQGTALGRRGRVRVSVAEDGQTWVGGRVFDVVSGTI